MNSEARQIESSHRFKIWNMCHRVADVMQHHDFEIGDLGTAFLKFTCNNI